MANISSSVQFKAYGQQQIFLLPPSLDELIDEHDLVRVVNQVVEAMDITALVRQYKGGGTTAYHPRMLLKILLYAYCVKIYTGRKIAKALRQDIHFMWLAGMNKPDFRTINNFRSSKAKTVIESLFEQMLVFLMDHGYIKMENYFCDGSTFSADAGRYGMTWKKNAERYKANATEQCRELFRQIDELNAAEERQYQGADLQERGLSSKEITAGNLSEQVEKLDAIIESSISKPGKRKALGLKKQLKEKQQKIAAYQQQIETAGQRSGYSKTDEDATAMRMKNGELLPAYNILAGCEDQFIVNVSVHQNSNDASCFPEHLGKLEQQKAELPKAIVADAIFGTEQNYELLEGKQVAAYLKYPSFQAEQKQAYQQNPFLKDNFHYHPLTDSYTCPNQQQLVHTATYGQTYKRTGYHSTIKEYQCQDCSGCPFYQQCCKSTNGENRLIKVNEKLDAYRKTARENLKSDRGRELREKRGVEIESCFGDIKHNMGFRRFHLRGLKKIETEISLVAMAHNLRKLHLNNPKNAA